MREYNHERPHEALNDQPPASRYVPSAARAAARGCRRSSIPAMSKSAASSSNGCVSWADAPLFVATPLAGEDVAFEEVDDGLWTLHFATVALGSVRRTSSPHSPDCPAVTAGRSASSAGSAPDLKNEKTMTETFDQLLPMSLD